MSHGFCFLFSGCTCVPNYVYLRWHSAFKLLRNREIAWVRQTQSIVHSYETEFSCQAHTGSWTGLRMAPSGQPFVQLTVGQSVRNHLQGWGGRWGGGIELGNTCKSMADSCQCMAKTTTYIKLYLLIKKNNDPQKEQ